MGRHRLAALAARHASRLDGSDRVKSSDEVGPGPRPSAKAAIERFVLRVRWMIVSTGGVRLPCFHQHVLGHVARTVKNPSLNGDALAGDIATGDIAAEIIRE